MPRPRIDLDPLGRMLDRLLEHPIMGIVDDVAPELGEGIRHARANLPDVAAELQARAMRRVAGEAGGLLRELGRELDAMTGNRKARAPARRRLPPKPKRKAPRP